MGKYIENFQSISDDYASYDTKMAYLTSELVSYHGIISKFLMVILSYTLIIISINFLFNLNLFIFEFCFFGVILWTLFFGKYIFNLEMQKTAKVHLSFDRSQQILSVMSNDHELRMKADTSSFAQIKINRNIYSPRIQYGLAKSNLSIKIYNEQRDMNLCLVLIDCSSMMITPNLLNEITSNYQPIFNWLKLALKNDVDINEFKKFNLI